jgi:TetR/AcrR family transcriptional repressor of nem operon
MDKPLNDKNTRERLIDAAFEEIYDKGYQGAALADILTKADVNKGSMYHFFANKKEMALISIEEKILNRFSQRYGRILGLESAHLDEFINSIKDVTQRDFRRGCPIANIVQEMSNLDEDFNKLMKTIYAEFRTAVKAILDKAVEAGEVRQCDTTKLALFVTVVIEGAILSVKASGDEADYLSAIDELIVHLDTYRTKAS